MNKLFFFSKYVDLFFMYYLKFIGREGVMKRILSLSARYTFFSLLGLCIPIFSGNELIVKKPLVLQDGFVYCADNIALQFKGYFCLEGMCDTRQFFSYNLDHYVVFPLPVKCDARCQDINDTAQLQMLAYKIYVTSMLHGPKIWGAQSYGEVKFNFVGTGIDPIISKLRLGYIKLSWEDKTKLLIGMYYNPISLDEIFPDTVTDGFGIGYDPFDYSPQVRLKHKVDKFEFTLATVKIYWFKGARWSAIPDFHIQANIHAGKQLLGVGAFYRSEVPRLETDKGYKTKQQLNCLYPFVFTKLKFKMFKEPFLLKARLTYCENGAPFDIIGAYAVKWRNPQTDERVYVNMRALAFWSEFLYKGSKKVEPAFLVGYTKNLGAPCRIQKYYVEEQEGNNRVEHKIVSLLDVPGLTNASYMLLVAPRLKVTFGPLRLGFEIEYTRAAFARSYDCPGWQHDFDSRGRVIRAKPVGNVRFYIQTRYNLF